MFKSIVTVATFFALICSQSASALTVNSHYDSDSGRFVTEASVDLQVASELSGKIGNDFKQYREWALKGINGGEGNPRQFISLVKDVVFSDTKKPFGQFTVIYDVDLPTPFDRKDEHLKFTLTDYQASNGKVERYSLVLDDSSMVIRDFTLAFNLVALSPESSRISFRSEFELRALFNAFFSLERYRNNIEWRIVRMVENLQRRAKELSANMPKPKPKP